MTCDDISRSFQGHVTFNSFYRERQIACMVPTDMAYYVANVASRLNDFMWSRGISCLSTRYNN